ncbi:MAG: TetR/AcrR family transcriptional regulator [Pelolinea sp.]|nr:TetR/AcrR family transcriptional regulator [Pelolinea sp.]
MQSRSQETRRQIKSAAIEKFCRSGYDVASVAEICKQAGVSKGAFYHHFPSKQSLFLSIMEDWLQGIDSKLFNRQTPEKKVPQTIQEMGSTLGIVFKAASGQLPMFMEFLVQASRDIDVWKAVITPYREYQQSFARLINEGKNEGSFKMEIDAEGSAWVLISLAVGILLQGVLDPEAADWNSITNKGVQMILDALQKGES